MKPLSLPPGVSRHYNRDWQFAARHVQAPLFRAAALTISLTPLVLGLFETLKLELFGVQLPGSFWWVWLSSMSYLAAWGIFQLKCPRLIRDYKHFGEFEAEKHSHRWGIWLFYNHVQTIPEWEKVVTESFTKGLSRYAYEREPFSTFRFCPAFPAPSDDDTQIFAPVNANRDLYMPIHHDGQRAVMTLQESDPDFEWKYKELFWILFTHITKAHPKSRKFFWGLTYLSFALSAIPLSLAVWKVATYLVAPRWLELIVLIKELVNV